MSASMQCFAITNQKGGVGKTTTSVNLAAACAALGKRVLLVDLDPQANATTATGVNKAQLHYTIYHGLLGSVDVHELIQKPGHAGYHLLPSNRHLAGAEIDLVDIDEREQRLNRLLQPIKHDYDLVFIDSPPSLSLLTINGLCAAHGVIVPMQCEYFALEGLSDLVHTIGRVRQKLNPALVLIGLLRVMYDTRTSLQIQVSSDLKTHFGDKVFNTIIPRNVRLAEAPSYGKAAIHFDPQAKGTIAYFAFAREFLTRIAAHPTNLRENNDA